MDYDIMVIGSGPGGYVAAIRASQLGLKTAVVERESLGGVCLNWGCIPTKALLKSASVFQYLQHAEDYGLKVETRNADFAKVLKRSRNIADKMSSGVDFLMKKNRVQVIYGTAQLKGNKAITVTDKAGKATDYTAQHIVIATGARTRELPNLKQDGKKIIGYRQALALQTQPKSAIVVGAGALGVEFAYFYNAMGTSVTLVEYLDRLVPVEDADISEQLARSFKKQGIAVMTDSTVIEVNTRGRRIEAKLKTPKGESELEADIVLSAVGFTSNIENIGLAASDIQTQDGKIVVNDFYETTAAGYYAIGDVIPGPALAHVASAEGILCVEKIAGKSPAPLDYGNIPGCTYCTPQIASVGLTEDQARTKGYGIRVGKFPFSASGKATANGATEGFVKVIYDEKYGEWLGCHMIGEGVTELIAEAVAARKLETTGQEICKAVHPHPTLSEALMEATAHAYGKAVHI
ncbi:MAG: dihydrolipoyl dehydrogenase [Flavobacteriales bacterium]